MKLLNDIQRRLINVIGINHIGWYPYYTRERNILKRPAGKNSGGKMGERRKGAMVPLFKSK